MSRGSCRLFSLENSFFIGIVSFLAYTLSWPLTVFMFLWNNLGMQTSFIGYVWCEILVCFSLGQSRSWMTRTRSGSMEMVWAGKVCANLLGKASVCPDPGLGVQRLITALQTSHPVQWHIQIPYNEPLICKDINVDVCIYTGILLFFIVLIRHYDQDMLCMKYLLGAYSFKEWVYDHCDGDHSSVQVDPAQE